MTAGNRHSVKCDECLGDGGWWEGLPPNRVYVPCFFCDAIPDQSHDAIVAAGEGCGWEADMLTPEDPS